MRASKGTAVFLDTTIQIARVVHDVKIKQRIKERIDSYTLRVQAMSSNKSTRGDCFKKPNGA